MHVNCFCCVISAEKEVDIEKPYAVVEFLDTKGFGITAVAWLTDDKKATLWPKRATNEKGWLKSLKIPRTPAELSRSWMKLACRVITYAGECNVFRVNAYTLYCLSTDSVLFPFFDVFFTQHGDCM